MWNYEIDDTKKYIINSDGKVEKEIIEEKDSLLPEEYQEVEYIESTGTQRIDTRLILNDYPRCKIEIYGNFTDLTINQHVLGVQNETNQAQTSTYVLMGLKNRKFFAQMGNGGTEKYIRDADLNKHKFTMNLEEEKYYIDETSYDFDYYCDNVLVSITLFCKNSYRQLPSMYSKFRMYESSFMNTNGILRDFIPCYTKVNVIDVNGKQCSANTKGLYDLVEGKFYTNQGSGDDFIAGPDV